MAQGVTVIEPEEALSFCFDDSTIEADRRGHGLLSGSRNRGPSRFGVYFPRDSGEESFELNSWNSRMCASAGEDRMCKRTREAVTGAK